MGLPPANWSGHWSWDYSEYRKCSGLSPLHPWCMGERNSNATYRSFNYPHHTASYWAMYHVARHYDRLRTLQPWQWYLERAAKTSLRFDQSTGVMDGTVFREVLRALHAEGVLNATFAGWATQLEARMKARQQRWARTRFPYGSEFSFDTTGQEEVVVWNLYFGNETAAKATVDHILSYMRSMPSWAYNGGARAADSGNGGKWLAGWSAGRPDRGQMHYRAGLNMIPLIVSVGSAGRLRSADWSAGVVPRPPGRAVPARDCDGRHRRAAHQHWPRRLCVRRDALAARGRG